MPDELTKQVWRDLMVLRAAEPDNPKYWTELELLRRIHADNQRILEKLDAPD